MGPIFHRPIGGWRRDVKAGMPFFNIIWELLGEIFREILKIHFVD
jgi:hypothetical protein